MKKLALSLFVLALVVSSAVAANAPVNIVYPIHRGVYNDYVTFEFSTTCPGGPNSVKWAIDGNGIGSGEFYDTFNAQFQHKLGTGWHSFEVHSSCGTDGVKFFVN
jgi:hypothetical protein